MLEILVGAPGAGKSYSCVAHHIIPVATAGRLVITNIPVNPDKLDAFFPGSSWFVEVHEDWAWWRDALSAWNDCEAFKWRNPKVPGQAPLVVIDEARELIHANNKSLPGDMENFFSRHRHAGLDVVIATQNMTDLYMPVRKLAVLTWRVRNLAVLGAKGRYWRVCYDGHGMKTRVGNAVVGKYDPHIYEVYQSFTAGGGAFDRATRPIWADAKFKFLGAALVVLLVWNAFHPPKKLGGQSAVSQAPPAVASVASNQPSALPPAAVDRPSKTSDDIEQFRGDDFAKLLDRADKVRLAQAERDKRLAAYRLDSERFVIAERTLRNSDLIAGRRDLSVGATLHSDGEDLAEMSRPRGRFASVIGCYACGDPDVRFVFSDGDKAESVWSLKRLADAGYKVEFRGQADDPDEAIITRGAFSVVVSR